MLEILDELDAFATEVSQEAALLLDGQGEQIDAFAEINSRGGLDRETAMRMVNSIPSMENYQPNDFSMFPTDMNLSVAVESFWSSLAEGIESLFGLIFKLIFGTIDFMLKPLYWLLGVNGDSGSNGGGSIGGAESKVASAEDTVEKIEELKPDNMKEVGEKATDALIEDMSDKPINLWQFHFIKHGQTDIFKSTTISIININNILRKVTAKFIEDFGDIEKGEKFATQSIELGKLVTEGSSGVAEQVTRFTSAIGKMSDIKQPASIGIAAAVATMRSIDEAIKEQENTEVDVKLIRQHYNKFAKDLKREVAAFGEDLKFKKSDEELVKELNKFSDEFKKLEKKVTSLSGAVLEEKNLEAKDATELKALTSNLLQLLRSSNEITRVMMGSSIKGKRGVFRSITIGENMVKHVFAVVKGGKE